MKLQIDRYSLDKREMPLADSRPVKTTKVFINTQMIIPRDTTGDTTDDTMMTVPTKVEYNDVFSEHFSSLLLVEGHPGSGKTTLDTLSEQKTGQGTKLFFHKTSSNLQYVNENIGDLSNIFETVLPMWRAPENCHRNGTVWL